MKRVAFVCSLLITCSLLAQTKRIEHKSHAGNFVAYSLLGDEAFGLGPSYRNIDTIIILNDSTTVLRTRFQYSDTVINHPVYNKPGVNLDSIRKLPYSRHAVIIKAEPIKEKVVPQKKKEKKKKSFVPFISSDHSNGSMMYFYLLMFGFFIALLYLVYQSKLNRLQVKLIRR